MPAWRGTSRQYVRASPPECARWDRNIAYVALHGQPFLLPVRRLELECGLWDTRGQPVNPSRGRGAVFLDLPRQGREASRRRRSAGGSSSPRSGAATRPALLPCVAVQELSALGLVLFQGLLALLLFLLLCFLLLHCPSSPSELLKIGRSVHCTMPVARQAKQRSSLQKHSETDSRL